MCDFSKVTQQLGELIGIHTQVSPTSSLIFFFFFFLNKSLMPRPPPKKKKKISGDIILKIELDISCKAVKTDCKEESKAVESSGVQAK